MPKRLRIFISSPGDVPDERLRADLIVDKLSQDYGRFFTIESYRWEHEAMLASKHFQDAIEPPSAFDIVVLIVWSRLGTPLPERTSVREYHGIDGRVPVTGSEWEYEDALCAAREHGAPDILAFRNAKPATVDALDPEARDRSIQQLQALDAFWRRHFADRGIFLAAYSQYHSLEEFAARLEESLRKLIERRVKEPDSVGAPLWMGNPFRGLAVYEFEHAPIFFGRGGMVAKAAEQLAVQARAGSAFLLISGASGSGKSSLVRAALVPRLMKPQRISGAAFVRRVLMRPSQGGADVFGALADALVGGSTDDGVGLRELLGKGQTAAQLAAYLRSVAAEPSFIFAAALGRLTGAGRTSGHLLPFEEAKLILVIDQIEELFTTAGISAEDQKLFARILSGLARSGAVWVIATIRSDFWHRVTDLPDLLELAQGYGRLDLAAPAPSELAEMIRQPADVAGLSFEADPQTLKTLDATLADAAVSESGVLPLMSFTLDELYRQDILGKQGKVLTYATYDALGGLEGAIATRAEEVLTALPPSAQQALPRVLRMLVTVTPGAERVAVARPAPLTSLAPGSDARKLVDALTAARLLVASSDGGVPMVRLAHEALISRWARARDHLLNDRRDLETRDVIERQMKRWKEGTGGQRQQLLLRDPDLANAVDLQKRWGDELDGDTRKFIQVSEQRARFRQRLAFAAAAVFFLVAVGAGIAAIEAYTQKQNAEHQRQTALAAQAQAEAAQETASEQRQIAQKQQQVASAERDTALTTQANLLANQAARLISQGDIQTAILLSLEALRAPDDAGPDRYNLQAEVSLLNALYRNPLRAILRAGASKYVDAEFVFDDSILVTIAEDGTVAFWNMDAGAHVTTKANLTVPFGPVTAVTANPARPILVFQGKDHSYFAWNYQTQQRVPGVNGKCSEDDAKWVFEPTGVRLFVYCSNVSIFNLLTGNVVHTSGKFDNFALAPNGKQFAVNTGQAITVMDGTTAAVITKWQQSDHVQGLAMNYDGTMVLTQNVDGVQFHDSKTGRVAHPPLHMSQSRTDGVLASPTANILETDGDDGSEIWNFDRFAPIQLFSGSAVAKTFLPNGYLVASNDKKMSLWEYVVEGHRGTREAVDHADLYVEEGHTFLTHSADSKKIITLTQSGDLYVWSSDPAMLLNAVDDKGEQLGDPAAISANGKVIVTTSAGATDDKDRPTAAKGVITVWDAVTLKPINHVQPAEPPAQIAVSGDGSRILYYVNKDGKYDILDVATLKSIQPAGLPRVVYSAALSSDGQTVALGYSNGVSLWRTADGSNVQKCSAVGNVVSIEFADNGMIAYAMNDGTVYLLPPDNCNSHQIFAFDVSKLSNPVDVDIGSKHGLIWAYLSSHLQLWNEAQSRKIFDRTGDQWFGDVVSEQRFIYGKDGDQYLHIYDLADPKNPVEILQFQADTNDCCFPADIIALPSGSELMTQWSERGAYRLRTWRLFPSVADATALAKSIVPECISPEARAAFFLQPEPPTWCIQMKKRPYDTPQWQQWLAAKTAPTAVAPPPASAAAAPPALTPPPVPAQPAPPAPLPQWAQSVGLGVAPPPSAPPTTPPAQPSDDAIAKFTVAANLDIYGQDIPSPSGQIGITDIDLNECATQCNSKESCVAFSFDRWKKVCYLKNKVVTPLLDPPSLAAVKKEYQNTIPNKSNASFKIELLRNRRFSGQPSRHTRVSGFPACTAACKADQNCLAFSFLKDTRMADNCQIFRDPEQGHVADPSTDSGYKSQVP